MFSVFFISAMLSTFAFVGVGLIILMTDFGQEPTGARDIARTISDGTGLGLDYFGGLLSIYQLEDGDYVVCWEDDKIEHFVPFHDPLEAARFFINKRHELELGFDKEVEYKRMVLK